MWSDDTDFVVPLIGQKRHAGSDSDANSSSEADSAPKRQRREGPDSPNVNADAMETDEHSSDAKVGERSVSQPAGTP